jgi:hypothetical protein
MIKVYFVIDTEYLIPFYEWSPREKRGRPRLSDIERPKSLSWMNGCSSLAKKVRMFMSNRIEQQGDSKKWQHESHLQVYFDSKKFLNSRRKGCFFSVVRIFVLILLWNLYLFFLSSLSSSLAVKNYRSWVRISVQTLLKWSYKRFEMLNPVILCFFFSMLYLPEQLKKETMVHHLPFVLLSSLKRKPRNQSSLSTCEEDCKYHLSSPQKKWSLFEYFFGCFSCYEALPEETRIPVTDSDSSISR